MTAETPSSNCPSPNVLSSLPFSSSSPEEVCRDSTIEGIPWTSSQALIFDSHSPTSRGASKTVRRGTPLSTDCISRFSPILDQSGMHRIYLSGRATPWNSGATSPTVAVAWSVFPTDPSIAISFVKQQVREVRALKYCALHNISGVVKYIGYRKDDSGSHILTEWCNKGTLAKVLEQGELSFNAAIQMMRTIAETVASLHRHAIFHGDLKPENIFLTDKKETGKKETKIGDFECAYICDHSDFPSEEDRGIGTLIYNIPRLLREECVEAKTRLQARDIYALGATFYEILAKEKLAEAVTSDLVDQISRIDLAYLHSTTADKVQSALRKLQPPAQDLLGKMLLNAYQISMEEVLKHRFWQEKAETL